MDPTIHLTLDEGNSTATFAIILNGKLKKVVPFENLESSLNDIKTNRKIPIIKSSVKDYKINYKHLNVSEFDVSSLRLENQFLEMPVNYNETLGIDRLVQSYYLFKLFKGKSTLLIDSGTFLTLNWVSSTGFDGGYILPGINLLKSSYDHGENLNALDEVLIPSREIPKNTLDAMNMGAGLLIEGALKEALSLKKVEHIVVTGGNGEFVKDILEKLFKENVIKGYLREKLLIHKALYFLKEQHSGDIQ